MKLIRDTCDLCGSVDHRPVADVGRGGEPLLNVVCERCGLVFVKAIAEDSPPELYASGQFTKLARSGVTPDQGKHRASEIIALRRYQRLAERVSLKEGMSALEVGCGTGAFLHLLRGRGLDVVGVEPDLAYAEAGRDRYQVEIRSGKLEDVDFGGKFDLIASFHVLEHADSPTAFLRVLREHMADEGTVYLEVPVVDRPYGGDLETFFWRPHITSFSIATLRAAMASVGLVVEDHGFDDDFLWLIGAPGSVESRLLSLPAEDPKAVASSLAGWHAEYLSRSGTLRQQLSTAPVVTMRRDAGRALRKSIRVAREFSRRRRSVDLVQFGQHQPENAGDILLFPAVRRTFDRLVGPMKWDLRELWPEVTARDVSWINKHSGGVVVGGGGLFLRDTAANKNSGWQWNVSEEHLGALEVPLVVYAVGYNRFRGQAEFDAVFETHLRSVVERSAFFGVRNHGSMRALRQYLPGELHDRVVWQPCPTTVLSYLHEDATARPQQSSRVLGLNLAFDRMDMRLGEDVDAVLASVARAARRLADSGWTIRLMVHDPTDAEVVPWLERFDVPFTTVDLSCSTPASIIDAYRGIGLAIGMRGHAQMIPFGIGAGIISLISHDKMQWFLEDLGHPEWGLEVRHESLTEDLLAAVEQFTEAPSERHEAAADARSELWSVTRSNAERIRGILGVRS